VWGALLVALFVLTPTFVPITSTYAAAGQDARMILPQAAPADPACPICLAKARWWEWAETVVTMNPPIQTELGPIQSADDGKNVIDWMRIVYQAPSGGINGDSQIYYHNFVGSDYIVPLTSQGSNTQPRLSPDLARILFVSNRAGRKNRELYLINPDGTGETQLTFHAAHDMMPAWAPDGQQLVFVSERDGQAELYTMRRDGSNLQRLTSNALDDLYPSWSPDGKTIAWVQVNDDRGDLRLMDADGTNVRTLQQGLRFLARPAWSPDGAQLAFDYDGNEDGFNEPYRLALAGGAPQLIPTPELGRDEWWVSAWEPAGRSILMTYIHFGGNGTNVVADDMRAITVCFDPAQRCDEVSPTWYTYANSTDIRSADPLPPTAGLRTLAPFARIYDAIAEVDVTDQGGSLVKEVELQYRQPTEASWHLDYVSGYRGDHRVLVLPNASSLPLGQYVYRVRASDYAGNYSPWSATGTTFIYMKTASGQVTDNRGVPLAGVEVAIKPTPLTQSATDVAGHYHTYLATVTDVQIADRVQHDEGELDYRHDFYVKPPANLVTYGDFEILALRGAWAASGLLTPTLQSEIVAGGDYAVRLGGLCTGICMQGAENTPTLEWVYSLTMDEAGVLHLVALINQVELTYWQRSADGEWSAPELLYSGSEVSAVTGAVNRAGDFVTAWEAAGGNNRPLYVRTRMHDGQWLAGGKVAGGRNPRLFLDEQARWHLFYAACVGSCSYETMAYTYQLPSGAPSSYFFPVPVDEPEYDPAAAVMAVTPTGVPHFVYSVAESETRRAAVLHKIFNVTRQTWSVGEEIPQRSYGGCAFLFIDHRSSLHLLCLGRMHMSYFSRTPNGQWRELAPVLYTGGHAGAYMATLDRDDVLHLFQAATSHSSQQGMTYLYKRPDAPWSSRQPLTDLSAVPPWAPANLSQLTAGPTLAGIGGDAPNTHLLIQPRAAVIASSRLAKQLTIPADLHQPTLSFMMALHSDALPLTSHFAVAVTAGVTTTTVLSTATPTDWRLAWVDLTPWQGETITLTFAVQQAAGEPYLQAYLDEIAVGAWATGVVDALEPATVPVGQATTVIAHGHNLRPGLQLHLGQTAIGDVQVEESGRRATFTVPRTLGPGAYPLYVTAAGQSHPSYGGLLFVGEQVWLPHVAR